MSIERKTKTYAARSGLGPPSGESGTTGMRDEYCSAAANSTGTRVECCSAAAIGTCTRVECYSAAANSTCTRVECCSAAANNTCTRVEYCSAAANTTGWGPDSSVGIGSWTVRRSNPGKCEISAPVQPSAGTHPAYCTMGLFPEGKVAEAWR